MRQNKTWSVWFIMCRTCIKTEGESTANVCPSSAKWGDKMLRWSWQQSVHHVKTRCICHTYQRMTWRGQRNKRGEKAKQDKIWKNKDIIANTENDNISMQLDKIHAKLCLNYRPWVSGGIELLMPDVEGLLGATTGDNKLLLLVEAATLAAGIIPDLFFIQPHPTTSPLVPS